VDGLRSGVELFHQFLNFAAGIGPESFKQIKGFDQVHASLAQLDPCHHPMLTTKRRGEITLRHASFLPQRTYVLAEDLGSFAVEWLVHPQLLPENRLASKMRADMMPHKPIYLP